MKKKILFFLFFLKIVFFINYFTYNNNNNNNNAPDIDTDNSAQFLNNINLKTNKKLLSYNNEPLEVHLIPHSHCDASWLKTFDEYMEFKVNNILTGVVNELNNDIEKKFNWAEIGFFSNWYNKQDKYTKEIVKKLIASKQLEFISGGWVQNDEATANLDDVIEQMTQGHMWLKDNFNVTVHYGWQIDPFGYSSLTPTLFSKMGFKGLIINRVSDSVRQYMKNTQQMDFLWKGSETLDKDSELIVSTLDSHYSYPDAIKPSNMYFYKDRARMFANQLKNIARTRNTNIIPITLGDDFNYVSASFEFSSNDEWINYMQENLEEFGLKKIGYSTLSEYFEALQNKLISTNTALHLYNKDFFPYSTGFYQYWTGYYSTRPVLKRQIRETSDLLRNSESLYTFAKAQYSSNSMAQKRFNSLQDYLEFTRNEVSLAQHHDTVTGTSRNYVLKDIYERLKNSRVKTYNVISNSIEYLLNKNQIPVNETFEYQNVVDLTLLNSQEAYSIVFHNSLGWSTKKHASIRIKANKDQVNSLKMYDLASNKSIPIQIIPLNDLNNECQYQLDEYILFAIVSIPALGLNTYTLNFEEDPSKQTDSLSIGRVLDTNSNVPTFETDRYTITFKKNGHLETILDKKSGTLKKVNQYFREYHTQRGGTYIFNAGPIDEYLESPSRIIFYDGPLVSQLTIIYNKNSTDVMDCNETSMVTQRIYKCPTKDASFLPTENYLETGYSIIGEMNKERTIHYKVESVSNRNDEFFTDNGLETRKRIHQKSSVTSNYYPTLHYVNIKDQDKNQQFTVYVDRSVGVTSTGGDIEIMFHRTIEFDDQKGLGWASRDSSRSDGKFYFNFDSIDNQKQNEKRISLEINHPVMYMAKKISNLQSYRSNYNSEFSPLAKDLPDNIHLQSLKTYSNNRVGLRLFNFKVNDDSEQSQQPLNIDLFSLFKTRTFKEKGLSFMDYSNNNFINDFKTKKDNNFPIKSGESEYIFKKSNNNNNNNNNNIKINPLEIKSYFIDLNNNNNNIYNDNNIIFNSVVVDKLVEDSRYPYDFSIYPISLASYDDNGKYIIIITKNKGSNYFGNIRLLLYLLELFFVLFIFSVLIVHLLIKNFY
ncbi:hypothetical protein DICPUDRAFT_45100 [Dictyostelium purpureum]|uniref:alpha-mannosidase n=1 Tax=Dictyostelium purpureum TaxID=5786 RepID=F0Z8X6_DICPU|nr:uncharacterized protein DICPUDRAFT_45100 [Dictyostelium purpureum]EGC39653.1 hypothetical protein DICPUDRAFT_45100 [Dictyostelium purpureum]|eukprot:XP_003283874.1 hypothetical protein DICPUDRAFT_45100 [Dictyostelium purpureum]